MLVIDIPKIAPEGLALDTALRAQEVHVEGEESFALESGQLVGRLERGDDESLHLRAQVRARLGLQCGRCLEPFSQPQSHELDVFFLPHAKEHQAREEVDEVELSDREMVVAYYKGDRIDLGELVREQLFLALPMKRLCSDTCRGLCPRCGTNLNLAPCACAPEESHFLPLKDLLTKGSR